MVDTAASGSVAGTQVPPPAGNPPPQTPPPGDQGSASGNGASWMSGLSEGNRKLAETKGWTEPEKFLSSYAEMEKLQGDSLRRPAPDAPKEEWDKFHTKLGRPESPDKYEFKRPDKLPPDFAYSDDLAKASKQWMFEAGLPPDKAQGLHDQFVTLAAQQEVARQGALKAERDKAVESTYDNLTKDWGPPDSDGFKEKLSLADRALKKLGLADILKTEKPVLLSDGRLADQQLARAMVQIAEVMFKDDTIDASVASMSGENPFKRGDDGRIKSPSAISALIARDPERAKQMAKAAGEPIENWMSTNPR